jgi:hypothetical protein
MGWYKTVKIPAMGINTAKTPTAGMTVLIILIVK